MCIRCVAKAVKEDVEDDYIMNRELIITNLYTYFSINNTPVSLTDDNSQISNDDINKHRECFKKLKEILLMIEDGKDQNDVLLELEILEMSMDFLQRHARKESNRRLQIYDFE